MKLFTIILCLIPFLSHADVDIIYGADNRIDLAMHKDATIRELGKSTLAQIHKEYYDVQRNNRQIKYKNFSYKDYGACADEPYSSQPALADCTAFIISPDHILTAGHCVDQEACLTNTYSWILDYAVDGAGKFNPLVSSEKVYSCQSIVKRAVTRSGFDYAIVELDRSITDRKPLKLNLNASKRAIKGTELFTIGYPTGLPAKVADGAKVTRITPLVFFADLDTYGGNSGSPVFNLKTKEVEGILVEGSKDFIESKKEDCFRSNRVHTPGVEGIFIISNIKDLETYTK